jgi:hypothetical protein
MSTDRSNPDAQKPLVSAHIKLTPANDATGVPAHGVIVVENGAGVVVGSQESPPFFSRSCGLEFFATRLRSAFASVRVQMEVTDLPEQEARCDKLVRAGYSIETIGRILQQERRDGSLLTMRSSPIPKDGDPLPPSWDVIQVPGDLTLARMYSAEAAHDALRILLENGVILPDEYTRHAAYVDAEVVPRQNARTIYDALQTSTVSHPRDMDNALPFIRAAAGGTPKDPHWKPEKHHDACTCGIGIVSIYGMNAFRTLGGKKAARVCLDGLTRKGVLTPHEAAPMRDAIDRANMPEDEPPITDFVATFISLVGP